MTSASKTKVFKFKKQEIPSSTWCDEDDEDDFKPSVRNPYPSGSHSSSVFKRNQKVEFPDTTAGDDNKKIQEIKLLPTDIRFAHDNQSGPGVSASSTTKEPSQEFLATDSQSSNQENFDDPIFLYEVDPEKHEDNGKSAWKNLMKQMQDNQKSSTLQNSRKKASSKRVLTLSPKVKGGISCSKAASSPVRKNPRVGSNLNNQKQVQRMLNANANPEFIDLPNKAKATDNSTKTFVRSLSDTDFSKGDKMTVSGDVAHKALASIFLPPAERKALQKMKPAVISGDTEELLECAIQSSLEAENDMCDNPEHFTGNNVIMNLCPADLDPYDGKKTKTCPFYKKLPGVPFCVDAFNYGLIPGMEVYFLSHFHSDHYIGLNKKFCKTIICSHPTGNLVRMKLYVEERCIRKLKLDKPYIICNSEVTLIDANHCPGSVMFIFRHRHGQVVLHTGDFRYTPDMLKSPSLNGLKIDWLYLDTTYCSPQYDFPTQSETILRVIEHVKKHLEHRPKTLILCGSYLIGKERVYFTLAETIGSKVFANTDKRRIINALQNRKFSSLLTGSEDSAKVHVVPMFSITAKNLTEYLSTRPQYSNIIGIKPSGWQFSSCGGSGLSVKAHYKDTVTIIGAPYSEHSSYSELKEFTTNLKPKKVQPTVNVGNSIKRDEMMQHIGNWLKIS